MNDQMFAVPVLELTTPWKMKYYRYRDAVICAPSYLSIAEIKEAWAIIFPALEHTVAVNSAEEENTIVFLPIGSSMQCDNRIEKSNKTTADYCPHCNVLGETKGMACICPNCGHIIWGI